MKDPNTPSSTDSFKDETNSESCDCECDCGGADSISDAPSPDEILGEQQDVYDQKNADYGGSWQLAGQTMSMWLQEMGVDELTIETDPETMISLGLYFQRFHKIARGFNGEFVVDDLNHESIEDSHRDELTYGSMHASLFTTDDSG